MIWIAYAVMYCADLAVGCWLIREGYHTAGGWIVGLSVFLGGTTLNDHIRKQRAAAPTSPS